MNGTTDDARRWSRLLDLAEGDLDHIAERFVAAASKAPDYATSSVLASDIHATALESLGGIVRRLRRGPDAAEAADDDELSATAVGLGARRARAGLPLDALMTAVRLDFSVLWGELTRIADHDDAPVLVTHAAELWSAVDAYAEQVRDSYLAEQQRSATEESARRREVVAHVFGPAVATSDGRARVLEGLGLETAEWFAVAVVHAEDLGGMYDTMSTLRRQDFEAHVHTSGPESVVFWGIEGTPEQQSRLLAPVLETRCGLVTDVRDVRGVAAAARTAAKLARALEPAERNALTVRTGWTRLARGSLADDGVDVRGHLEQALDAVRESDRSVIVRTVLTYLESGSVAEVAEREYCHRNTVLNRLRRFADVTGFDPSRPRDAALISVAWD